jgi:hypothetical protein
MASANTRLAIQVLSYAALACWLVWWFGNLARFQFQFADASWLPTWRFLGFDYMHNHLGAQAWIGGFNPYLQSFGDPRGLYSYPPIVLPLFSWAALVPDFTVAARLWTLFIAIGSGFCVWQVWRLRCAEGWSEVPFAAMLALVLWSSPVVFAMERGNCDVLVLLAVLLASSALNLPARWWMDALAALLLALAVTIKIYPLVVVVGLFALRRYRVLLFLGPCIAILLLPFGEYLEQWLLVMQSIQGHRINPVSELYQWLGGETMLVSKNAIGNYVQSRMLWGSLHSPGNWWPALWLRLGVESVASWPSLAVQFVMLTPVTLWGFWQIFRMQGPTRLALPILLWVMAVATFWMPQSYDYNLIYLPLLMVAVWDNREPRWLQFLLLLSLPWWLPFGPIGYDWALARVLLKLLALYVVTLILIRSLGRSVVPATLRVK